MITPDPAPQAVQPIHEAIENFQVRLYKLTTKSHVRIGAGEGSVSLSAADNPVIQALFYRPPAQDEAGASERVIYLPGSSLHGVIRAWSEKALRSTSTFLTEQELRAAVAELGDHQEEWLQKARKEVGDFIGEKAEDVSDEMLFQNWRVHRVVSDPLSQLDQSERFTVEAAGSSPSVKKLWFDVLDRLYQRKNPCPVSQVFGYVGQRGRVRIQHAFPAEGGLPLDIITRVAINRISGAADEGKLFDVEAVPPGAVFYFFVVLENMDDQQLKVFERGVRALQLQLATLGAHSTVGFGTVELEPVLTATIGAGLFEQSDLPNEVQTVVRTHNLHTAARGMDRGRYPSFYQALAMVDDDGNPPAIFGDAVTIQYGVG